VREPTEPQPSVCSQTHEYPCSWGHVHINKKSCRLKTNNRVTSIKILDLSELALTPVTLASDLFQIRLLAHVFRSKSTRFRTKTMGKAIGTIFFCMDPVFCCMIEYVSWKILKEDKSLEGTAMELLKETICGNVYCAYYIVFYETFRQVMEYAEEVEGAEDGTLEQAIKCFHSEEMGNWTGTEGAVEWILGCILESLNGKGDNGGDKDDNDDEVETSCLTKKDIEWKRSWLWQKRNMKK